MYIRMIRRVLKNKIIFNLLKWNREKYLLSFLKLTFSRFSIFDRVPILYWPLEYTETSTRK